MVIPQNYALYACPHCNTRLNNSGLLTQGASRNYVIKKHEETTRCRHHKAITTIFQDNLQILHQQSCETAYPQEMLNHPSFVEISQWENTSPPNHRYKRYLCYIPKKEDTLLMKPYTDKFGYYYKHSDIVAQLIERSLRLTIISNYDSNINNMLDAYKDKNPTHNPDILFALYAMDFVDANRITQELSDSLESQTKDLSEPMRETHWSSLKFSESHTECECGAKLLPASMSYHLKTVKHKRAMIIKQGYSELNLSDIYYGQLPVLKQCIKHNLFHHKTLKHSEGIRLSEDLYLVFVLDSEKKFIVNYINQIKQGAKSLIEKDNRYISVQHVMRDYLPDKVDELRMIGTLLQAN